MFASGVVGFLLVSSKSLYVRKLIISELTLDIALIIVWISVGTSSLFLLNSKIKSYVTDGNGFFSAQSRLPSYSTKID